MYQLIFVEIRAQSVPPKCCHGQVLASSCQSLRKTTFSRLEYLHAHRRQNQNFVELHYLLGAFGGPTGLM